MSAMRPEPPGVTHCVGRAMAPAGERARRGP